MPRTATATRSLNGNGKLHAAVVAKKEVKTPAPAKVVAKPPAAKEGPMQTVTATIQIYDRKHILKEGVKAPDNAITFVGKTGTKWYAFPHKPQPPSLCCPNCKKKIFLYPRTRKEGDNSCN